MSALQYLLSLERRFPDTEFLAISTRNRRAFVVFVVIVVFRKHLHGNHVL